MNNDTAEPDEPTPDVLVPAEADADETGWLHLPPPDERPYGGQGGPAYQVTRELDSENGPPPRRGGPTS